ncbi:hypothetical protein BDZ45DRAFT_749567 [Acephala macrosclerotiorum]|nr:hypothetical protein BDZ45DRAFT_749567 [Acephala macrosclerotiorum]
MPLERPRTTILRANSQIYFEGSDILYPELAVDDIAKRSQKVWRHNPLHGIGKEGPKCSRIYSTCPMDDLMDPHVFARFKKIGLQLRFDFTDRFIKGKAVPNLSIDSSFNVDSDETRVRFYQFISQTRILRDLTTALSNSSEISLLNIILALAVSPDFESTYNLEDDSYNEEALARDMVYFNTADTRAAEIVLDRSFMDPLTELINVESSEHFMPRSLYHDQFGGWQQMKDEYEEVMLDLQVDISLRLSLKNGGDVLLSEDDENASPPSNDERDSSLSDAE